jgi:hypothetical protein
MKLVMTAAEADYILNGGRCVHCRHLGVLHDGELGDCALCACPGGETRTNIDPPPEEMWRWTP